MKLLDMLRRHTDGSPLPPPPGRDPELVDHAIKTARALSKTDRTIERRHRLNLELARAEETIRSAREPGRSP